LHNKRVTVRVYRYLGWLMGLEPTTSSSTEKRSAIELQPPYSLTTHSCTWLTPSIPDPEPELKTGAQESIAK
jgi:hypothetical protein